MPTDQKIDYIELPAFDFEAVRAFYATAFEWVFKEFGPDYLAFTDDKLDGGFYKSSLKSVSSSGAALVVLYADELERTRDNILEAGGRLSKAIFAFPGGRRFHFLDPHGNELAVWSAN